MSRYGIQPARAHLIEQRWTTRRAAQEIGVDFFHLNNVLKGTTRPCARVRERLPELLGVPLDELFVHELICRPYTGPLRYEDDGEAAR